MRLVMLLLVRDEADVVAEMIRHHLARGVDAIVATDNGSTDGTVEILEGFARDGVLELHHEPARTYDQARWVTRMAFRARETLGADWLLPADADELWCGDLRTGAIADVRRCAVLQGLPPTPEAPWAWVTDPDPSPRHTARLADPAVPMPRWLLLAPGDKVLVRARRLRAIAMGNHDARHWPVTIRGRAPVTVLHRPIRSLEQLARKVRHAADLVANPAHGPAIGWHWRRWVALDRQGRLEDAWAEIVPDAAERGALAAAGRVRVDVAGWHDGAPCSTGSPSTTRTASGIASGA